MEAGVLGSHAVGRTREVSVRANSGLLDSQLSRPKLFPLLRLCCLTSLQAQDGGEEGFGEEVPSRLQLPGPWLLSRDRQLCAALGAAFGFISKEAQFGENENHSVGR